MKKELKLEVMESMDEFAHAVRMNRDYSDDQFERVKALLSDLAGASRNDHVIDKDLALSLYALPQTVRNMFLSYDGSIETRPQRFDRLEDAWIDLDALVLECLQPPWQDTRWP